MHIKSLSYLPERLMARCFLHSTAVSFMQQLPAVVYTDLISTSGRPDTASDPLCFSWISISSTVNLGPTRGLAPGEWMQRGNRLAYFSSAR